MKSIRISLIYLSLIFGLFFASCKDKDPTIAEVIVVDQAGAAVSGAKVRIYCSTGTQKTCDVEATGTSDASGMFSTEFKLPAVLKIEATKTITDTSGLPVTLLGEGYIKLVEHETVQQTVTMY